MRNVSVTTFSSTTKSTTRELDRQKKGLYNCYKFVYVNTLRLLSAPICWVIELEFYSHVVTRSRTHISAETHTHKHTQTSSSSIRMRDFFELELYYTEVQ